MEPSVAASPDYRVRRGEISAYGRALASSTRLRVLMAVVAVCLITALLLLALLPWPMLQSTLLLFVAGLVVFVLAAFWFLHAYVTQHFIEPDLAFRMWLQQVCDGDLDARIGLAPHHRHHKELNFHTRNLATSLSRLSDDMDSLVESQTKKLSEQKKALELLFKITSDVSSNTEVEVAFASVCEYLAQWYESTCVSCYRVMDDGRLRCLATHYSDDVSKPWPKYNPDVYPLTYDQIPLKVTHTTPNNESDLQRTWVPFFAGEQIAGVLIVAQEFGHHAEQREVKRVLSTVSEQLSLLCSQQMVQEQVLSARLSRDRNELAAEIHDSLAQTLLAMRYQTTLIGEKLKSQNDETYQDVIKLCGSIEEANEEVRGLIREYRTPLAEHRSADSLQTVIDQFSQSSDIPVFFQSDDPQIRFMPREEAALQRIIGEALNNARKYSQASMIRVYLNVESTGVRRILVEDDGVGFEQTSLNRSAVDKTNDSAEQIGLTIMQERALSIGAKVGIDSELGEGTRISISMPPLIEKRGDLS